MLDGGQTKPALAVLELLGLDYCVSLEARKLIERAAAIPASNVLISAVHARSAASATGTPIASRFVFPQKADEYQRFASRQAASGPLDDWRGGDTGADRQGLDAGEVRIA